MKGKYHLQISGHPLPQERRERGRGVWVGYLSRTEPGMQCDING